jgi:cell division septum initiation protein DivIVA
MNTRLLEQPEFTASIRGYDKLQVDDYLERLRALALEADERARTAESELEFSRHQTIGPRVSEIFELAVAEAKEMRERVVAETEEMRTQARHDSEEILVRARELAAEVDAETKRGREQAIAEVHAARAEAHQELDMLEQRKEAHLSDLRRLQESLASAAQLVSSVSNPRPVVEEVEDTRALAAG